MSIVSKASLSQTLRQTQPFRDCKQEAYLAVVRTASDLSHSLDLFLRPFEITQPQYNVLRILRGAGAEGLGRNEVRERMVNAMPDMSRLLDRMEKLGWLTRVRSDEDRRHVPTTITKAGLALLQKIDAPLAEHHQQQFQGVALPELQNILSVLEAIRSNLA